MRTKIVAGNWKMNCDLPQTQSLIGDLKKEQLEDLACELMIAPSHPFLYAAFNSTLDTPIEVVAQNVSEQAQGAFTGEISNDMLQSIGAKTVIIGHSERRDIYGEDDKLISVKVKNAIDKEMRVILCVGEHLEKRGSNTHIKTVTDQLTHIFRIIDAVDMDKIIIAYEPVWAIGTGETASPQQAQEMHHEIRKHIAAHYNDKLAQEISILYGGSVKPDNARELFSQPDVDGALVGGASLDASSFIAIARAF